MLDLEELLKKRVANRAIREIKKARGHWPISFLVLFLVCSMGWFYAQVRRLESKNKAMRQSIKILEQGIAITPHLGKALIPDSLAGVPFGEDLGVVLAVKEVDIRNVAAPFNPSLIQTPSGYDLFFRYDVMNPKLAHASYSSRIGVVPLNHQFEQGDQEFKRIHLETEYADDPRVLFVGDELYLFFNRLNEDNAKCRFMSAVNLDRNTYDVNYSTILDMNLQWVEKNWSPFEYVAEDGEPRLFLEYQITPRKLLELPNPQLNDLKNVTLPREVTYLSLPWGELWGRMSGGTPAQKIGDEYLSFFHSWFTDEKGLAWYVMGAYTFDSHPPFNITGISKTPLLFRGIYETPFTNTSSIKKRVIFPSGFCLEKQESRELIHLACGENDCAVKIVTIDKDKLIKSMVRF
jgi:predicted GH43/DUF377 family glycosyl hydrolase